MTQPVAVVSGISGGIGSAIGRRLLQEGYVVVGLSRHAMPRDTAFYTEQMLCDVRDAAQVGYVVRTFLRNYERCDVLVVAHGHPPITTPTAPLHPMTFTDVLLTDVYGAFLLAQAFGSLMLSQHHGDIVFVSSLHARQTYPARTAYAAAKAGVVGLMRSLALEWGGSGLKINAILPWQVDTPRTQALIAEARDRGEDLLEAYLQRSPQRRLVQPEDVAQSVFALVENPACNGVEWVLDGGVNQSMWHKGYKEPSDA